MRYKSYWSIGCLSAALIFGSTFPLIGKQQDETKKEETKKEEARAKGEPRSEAAQEERGQREERRRGPRPENVPGAPGFRLATPGNYPPGVGPQLGIGPPGGYPTPLNFDELKRNDPEMFELEHADRDLERATAELSAKFRQASAEERNEVKEQL